MLVEKYKELWRSRLIKTYSHLVRVRDSTYKSVQNVVDSFKMETSDSTGDLRDLEKRSAGQMDWLTSFCRTISFLTCMCALLCFMANATALFQATLDAENQEVPVHQWDNYASQSAEAYLRVSGVVCSVLVVLAETEWDRFMQYFAFLDMWVFRGMFHVMVAALTQTMAHATGNSDLARSVSLYRSIASTGLAACGFFYVLAGLVCIGAMRRARRRREVEKNKVLRELDEVENNIHKEETRRLELQHMLKD
mmetsp:Transcript_3315/g.3722  ORF Transcript_3315/g.3722 Transcript_3315/m.3722 type:complete len:251 (+) Transcript_3315:300-1052(+)